LNFSIKEKAFSLIEVVLVMLVIGISVTPLCLALVNIIHRNVFTQAHATAVALAEGEVERLTNARFSLVDDEAPVSCDAPFAHYSRETIVDYVDSGDLNTPVVGPTNYKRVQIKVNSPLSGEIVLTTVLANITNQ
jgi:prepilin-type N-terminal cleavage/methylation domain-containing protein